MTTIEWLVIGDDECAYVYDIERESLHNVHKIDTSVLECGDIKLICEHMQQGRSQ